MEYIPANEFVVRFNNDFFPKLTLLGQFVDLEFKHVKVSGDMDVNFIGFGADGKFKHT